MLPGETLNSYLYRLALTNQHGPHVVQSLCEEHFGEHESISRPIRTEVFDVVAALTGLEPYKIYWSSVHGFTELVTPRHVPLEKITCAQGFDFPRLPIASGRKHLRTDNRAQFCPHCLAEAAYQRRAWQLKMISACVQHQCLLIDRCPRCEQPISTAALIAGHCTHCQFNLLNSPTINLSGDKDGLQAQGVLFFWASSGPHVRLALPAERARELYTLLHAVRKAVFAVQGDLEGLHPFPVIASPFAWKDVQRLTMAENYVATATALQAMKDWPKGFLNFLDRYGRRDRGEYSSRLQSWIGKLLEPDMCENWRRPEYRFVYEVLVEYVRSNWPMGLVKKSAFFREFPLPDWRFDWMLVKEAADTLGVTERTVNRLVVAGSIHVREGTVTQRMKYLAQSDVKSLKERWDRALTLSDTAACLGVSEEVVVDLIHLDLLDTVRRPRENGSSAWQISAEAIEDLLAKVHSHSAGLTAVYDRVDLKTAAQILAVHGFNAAKVVQAVINKSIRGHCARTQVFDELVLSRKSVMKLLERSRDDKERISRQRTARKMCVKPCVIDIWVSQGLLTPVAKTKRGTYFKAVDVERFKSDYVFTSEVTKIIGVSPLTVHKWTRAGRLQPVSGPGVDGRGVYLFRRKDLERLRQENRLSLPQLARQLEVSHSQMHIWIQSGQLKPFSGPGIDECGRYLFLKDELEKAPFPGLSQHGADFSE